MFWFANSPVGARVGIKQGTTMRMTETEEFVRLNPRADVASTCAVPPTAAGCGFSARHGLNQGDIVIKESSLGCGWDADGNLTNDGRWVFTWDAENRLTQMESHSDAPSGSKLKLLFGYDAQSRRISKVVSNWSGSAWSLVSSNRFLYDGWNPVGILNSSSSLLASFTWGNDLNGSLQGAGGVGGLLFAKTFSGGALQTASFYGYDGNGNVMALVNAADGTVSAWYEYGPFGELIRGKGTVAEANPFRFSTKYQDNETDLLYYGYRFYSGSVGRWLSRDPIGERGGINLFGFAHDNPICNYDSDGRSVVPIAVVTCCVAGGGFYGGILINRALCRRIRDLNLRLAEAQADANAPDGSTHRVPGSRPGNDADMLTHCIATCDLVRKPGPCGCPDRALAFMQEREVGNDPATQIDRLNNEVGARVGMTLGPKQTCAQGCLDALDSGLLYTISNGQPAPSPPRR